MQDLEEPEQLIDLLQKIETSMVENSKSIAEEDKRSSTQWIKIAHKNSAYKSYLIYLKEKGQIQKYMKYLEEDKELVDENSSTRKATERMKEELPDECVACGFTNIEYHHVIPYRHGGETKVQNLAPLCSSCHKYIEQAEYRMADILRDELSKFSLPEHEESSEISPSSKFWNNFLDDRSKESSKDPGQ